MVDTNVEVKMAISMVVMKGLPVSRSVIGMFIFGVQVAAVVTLPFDVIKTHRQIELGQAEVMSGGYKVKVYSEPQSICNNGSPFIRNTYIHF